MAQLKINKTALLHPAKKVGHHALSKSKAFGVFFKDNALGVALLALFGIVGFGFTIWDHMHNNAQPQFNVTPQITAVVDPDSAKTRADVDETRTQILESLNAHFATQIPTATAPPHAKPAAPAPPDQPPAPIQQAAQAETPPPVNPRITTPPPVLVESDDYSEHYSISVANYIRNDLPSYGITVTTNDADAAAVLEVKHVSYDLEGNYSDEALEQNPADDQLPPQSSITIQLSFRPKNGIDKPFYQSFNCRRTAPPNSTQETADDLAMQADLLNIYQYLIGKTNSTTCPR